VRVEAPFFSLWSEVWSFTTASAEEELGVPVLIAPLSAGVGPMPLFRWNAANGADGYEIVVSESMDLSSPVIRRTDTQSIADNFWQCDITLDYGTPYYWRVRATGEPGCGAWSEKGVFVTVSETVTTATYTALSPPEPPSMPSLVNTLLPSDTSPPVIADVPPESVSAPQVVPAAAEKGLAWGWYVLGGVALGGCPAAIGLLLARRRKSRLL
jgi:hypothetical protein